MCFLLLFFLAFFLDIDNGNRSTLKMYLYWYEILPARVRLALIRFLILIWVRKTSGTPNLLYLKLVWYELETLAVASIKKKKLYTFDSYYYRSGSLLMGLKMKVDFEILEEFDWLFCAVAANNIFYL